MAGGQRALAVSLFSVAFGTNVSTPLLLAYEAHLGLSTWTVTALFAVYPLGLLPALVYSGPASDALGRRPLVGPSLMLSMLAAAVMIAGRDAVEWLFVGRFMLGAVSGLAFVVASAWMQELGRADPMWAARLTSLVLYGGFGLGPLVSGALGQWGPAPLVVPYLAQVTVIVVGLVAFRSVPETVARPDRRRSIRPNLGMPARSRRMFISVIVPTSFAVFGFPSLAVGLFPVLLRPQMTSIAVFVTGIVGLLTMAAIIPAQLLVARLGAIAAAPLALGTGTAGTLIGTVAIATGIWPLLFVAAILMGGASGLSMTTCLRLIDDLADPADRGALIGTFYAAAYAAMTMPLVVSTLSAAGGGADYATVLAGVSAAAALLTGWVRRATRISPAAVPSARG